MVLARDKSKYLVLVPVEVGLLQEYFWKLEFVIVGVLVEIPIKIPHSVQVGFPREFSVPGKVKDLPDPE